MLSGSRSVQSGVQRKETERPPKEKQTHFRSELRETKCVTNAVTFKSVQEHHRLEALMVTDLKRRHGRCSKSFEDKLCEVSRHEKKFRKASAFALQTKKGRFGFQAAESPAVSFSHR